MKERARTTEQKFDVIEHIYNLWLEHPDLRLGQLIGNCLKDQRDLYYLEDYDLIKILEEGYNHAN